nr:MAG TPA: hypothetical protein [Bacteriophage sp.]
MKILGLHLLFLYSIPDFVFFFSFIFKLHLYIQYAQKLIQNSYIYKFYHFYLYLSIVQFIQKVRTKR